MAVTSWTDGNVALNNPVGSVAWSNPDNAKTSDDSHATSALGKNSSTQELVLKDFGFSGTIGSGDTIDGIEVRTEKNSTSMTDHTVSLWNNDAKVGDNKADTVTAWPTTDGTVDYGGASDLWNASLTTADIRGTAFGAVLRGQNGGLTANANADVIQIRVHFTAGAGTPFQPLFNRRTPTYLRM